jgi:hypothetical protein
MDNDAGMPAPIGRLLSATAMRFERPSLMCPSGRQNLEADKTGRYSVLLVEEIYASYRAPDF